MAKAKQGKAKAVVVDMSNVSEGGQFQKKHYPSGDYRAKVTKVVEVPKKNSPKETQWLFTIEVKTGKYPYYVDPRAGNQAWKVRNLFVAAGINVPKKRVNVDPNKVVGKEIGVTLEDDEYEGKMNSSIAATFPTSELDGDEPDEDEDMEEAPKKSKKKKGADPVEAPQGSKKGKGAKGKSKGGKVKKSELEALDIEDV